MSNFMPPQKQQQQQQQPQMGGGVGPAMSAIGLQAAEVSKRPACACVRCVRASLPRAMKISSSMTGAWISFCVVFDLMGDFETFH